MNGDSSRYAGPRSREGAVLAGSGFTTLVGLVILHRYTFTVIGDTADAASAGAVALLLSWSLGALLGGRRSDRYERPLLVVALAEGIVGLFCIGFPLLLPGLSELYLSSAPRIGDASQLARHGVRFAWAFGVLLVPAFFSGVAAPALARTIASPRVGLAELYGWQGLGAAIGASILPSAVVPNLGLPGTLALAGLVKLGLAAAAVRTSMPSVPVSETASPGPNRFAAAEPNPSLPPLPWKKIAVAAGAVAAVLGIAFFGSVVSFVLRRPASVGLAGIAVLAAAVRSRRGFSLRPSFAQFLASSLATGALSFALAVLWHHRLAVLATDTVEPAPIIVTTLALGLAVGAFVVSRWVTSETRVRNVLGISSIVSGSWVLLTLAVWAELPMLFQRIVATPWTPAVLEAVRWALVLSLVLLPAAALGVTVVLGLQCSAAARSSWAVGVGLGQAALSLGAIAGTLASLYWLVPRFGSAVSLKIVGVLLVVAGGVALVAFSTSRRRRALAGIAISAIAWGPLVPVTWRLGEPRGATGTISDETLFYREDATGGLSVVDHDGIRTLRSNGRFAGDTGADAVATHRRAILATLFTAGRKRALVGELATGVMPAALLAQGFEEVVCAETRVVAVEAARQFFSGANANVVKAPGLELFREHPRSILSEAPERYDAILLEASPGSTSLWTRELYALASSRLRRHGVLVHRFSIDVLPISGVFVVLNTARAVFDHTSLWTHRDEALVVASNEPLRLDLRSVRSNPTPVARRTLVSGSPLELLTDLVVTDRDMDAFLDSLASSLGASRSEVSTDSRPPSPGARRERSFATENRAWFRRFRSAEPTGFRGEPTELEVTLASASFVRGWHDPRALPRLARLWSSAVELSAPASHWIYEELERHEDFGTVSATHPLDEIRSHLDGIGELVGSARAAVGCKPIPRFVSRVDNAALTVTNTSGESLDGTEPRDTVDGNADPNVGKGWRARPAGRPVFVDVAFDSPKTIGTVHVVVRPIDGNLARTRLLGRDSNGVWRPLASGAHESTRECRGTRRFRLGSGGPLLTELRVEVAGEHPTSRIALYELWVEES